MLDCEGLFKLRSSGLKVLHILPDDNHSHIAINTKAMIQTRCRTLRSTTHTDTIYEMGKLYIASLSSRICWAFSLASSPTFGSGSWYDEDRTCHWCHSRQSRKGLTLQCSLVSTKDTALLFVASTPTRGFGRGVTPDGARSLNLLDNLSGMLFCLG
jgi:hypothetical protein